MSPHRAYIYRHTCGGAGIEFPRHIVYTSPKISRGVASLADALVTVVNRNFNIGSPALFARGAAGQWRAADRECGVGCGAAAAGGGRRWRWRAHNSLAADKKRLMTINLSLDFNECGARRLRLITFMSHQSLTLGLSVCLFDMWYVSNVPNVDCCNYLRICTTSHKLLE